MSLICWWIKSHFHMKGWAPRFALRKKFKEIQKWPIPLKKGWYIAYCCLLRINHDCSESINIADCSEGFIKILNSAFTSFQLKTNEAVHSLWEQPSLNFQVKHLNLNSFTFFWLTPSSSIILVNVNIRHFVTLFIAWFHVISHCTTDDRWCLMMFHPKRIVWSIKMM